MKSNRVTLKVLYLALFVLVSCKGKVVEKEHQSDASTLANLHREDEIVAQELFRVSSYTEGVVFDNQGNGYISMEDQVIQFNLDGAFRFWAKVKGANGHKILGDGSHVVCSMTEGALIHLDKAGDFIGYLARESDGHPLKAPNDLTLDNFGGIYFTDPRGFNGNHELGSIHYLDANGKTSLVSNNLELPNGIICTPDGKRLIVALSGPNRIIQFTIISPGVVEDARVLSQLPDTDNLQQQVLPDGICLDRQGNIYIAHYGAGKIRVLNPNGELLRSYDAGNKIVSNVAFGGPYRNLLFMTGSIEQRPGTGGVFYLNLPGVKGLE